MYPEASHTLDWFHITMKLTVLNQFAKGLRNSDTEAAKLIIQDLESSKWYLWHGNSERALDKLDECYWRLEDEGITYDNRKRFIKHLEEFNTYITNNRQIIPNYGEKYRYGETITTAFVESTVNEVIAKRMVKKQQMQWTRKGAHYMIQTRTAVLNGELTGYFEQWYPGFKIDDEQQIPGEDVKMAA